MMLFFFVLLLSILLAPDCDLEPVVFGDQTFDVYCIESEKGEQALAAVDANRDHHLDLVVANQSSGSLTVFFGVGEGAFEPGSPIPAGENPTSVAIADLNGDEVSELVIANHETSYLTILSGDGAGNYRPSKYSPMSINVDPHPHVVALQDLDKDGDLELLVDHRNKGGLLLHEGAGNGRFSDEAHFIDTGGDPYLGFALGDLNNDGRYDIVTPNPRTIGVTLSIKGHDLSYSKPHQIDYSNPMAVVLADLNGDNQLDIVAASESGSRSVGVFLNSGAGTFPNVPDNTFQLESGAKAGASGDFNGDGVSDVLLISWNRGVLALLGDKESVEPIQIRATNNPWGLATGDFNNDGIDDFVIADGVGSDIRIYLSRP